MATFQRIEQIEAWQKARRLTREIYAISSRGAFARDFGLRDQIRRAAVSVMSNVAEGFERDGKGEFMQFLAVAKGSAGEVKSQLYVALDQQYVSQRIFDQLFELATETSRMIAGLMNYLRQTTIKGTKYQPTRN